MMFKLLVVLAVLGVALAFQSNKMGACIDTCLIIIVATEDAFPCIVICLLNEYHYFVVFRCHENVQSCAGDGEEVCGRSNRG